MMRKNQITPEGLQSAAVRGDRCLACGVLALAWLFGCSTIRDARVLVHCRSGAWLAEQGGWPTAHDPFSITTADQRWINLGWLFDLLSAGVSRFGWEALSLAQGVAAVAMTALVLAAFRPGIRIWGGTLVVALMLLVVYPHWAWRPETITLLGTAALLCLILRWEAEPAEAPSLYLIPPVFWVWCQLDPRAWIGLLLLILYCAGQFWTARRAPSSADVQPRRWGVVTLSAAVVAVCHPFGWETWWSPWQRFRFDLPALRETVLQPTGRELDLFPLWATEHWQQFDHLLAAGLLLQVAAIITLILNRKRASAGAWLMVLGINLLAWITRYELPVAAVVNGCVATVQAQEWYLARFGQIYASNLPEALFSRWGRVVTAIGFGGLGVMVATGRLQGPEPHRTGVGLSCSLRYQLDDLRRLSDVTPDERGFHWTLRQGDALIAAGRKSFVDHRTSLFSGRSGTNLLRLHHQTRQALQEWDQAAIGRRDAVGRRDAPPEMVAAVFDQYDVSHLLPDLTQDRRPPDYTTFLTLLGSPAWSLTDIWPTLALFLRAEGSRPEVNQLARERRLNALSVGFRRLEPCELEPRQRPEEATGWWSTFCESERCPPPGTQAAQHWLRLEWELPTAPIPFQLGASLAAVRAAQSGVNEAPDRAVSHRTLGALYAHLLRLETLSLAQEPVAWGRSLRYFQAIAPLRQAEALDAYDPTTQWLLWEVGQAAGFADVAHAALSRFLELTPADAPLLFDQRVPRSALEQLERRLAQVLDDNESRVTAALAADVDRLQIAQECHRQGCLSQAIALLDDDQYLSQTPWAVWYRAVWLAERGDGMQLDAAADRLRHTPPPDIVPLWQEPIAYAALGRGDYGQAFLVWQQEIQELQRGRLSALLLTSPLSTGSPQTVARLRYPLTRLAALRDSLGLQTEQAALLHWQTGVCELEAGRCEAARSSLRAALETAPNHPLRPLFRLYWFCLTDEVLDDIRPEDRIPDTNLFMPDDLPAADEAPATDDAPNTDGRPAAR